MAGDYQPTSVAINGVGLEQPIELGAKSPYFSVLADRASGNKSSILLTHAGHASEVEIGLKPGSAATLFPRPTGQSPGAVVVADRNPTPVADHALVRFVHLSEQQKDLTVSIDGRSINSLRLRATAFDAFAPGRFDVSVRTTSPDDSVISEFALEVTQDVMYTVVLSDAAPTDSSLEPTQLVVALIADRSFPNAAIADRSQKKSAGQPDNLAPATTATTSNLDVARPGELALSLDQLNGTTGAGWPRVMLRLLFGGGLVMLVADILRKLRGPRYLKAS
jgi:hypothetical protein